MLPILCNPIDSRYWPCLGALLFFLAPGAWSLSACDDLIVTDSLLLPQAQRLADFRNAFAGDDVQNACVTTVADLVQKYPFPGHRELSVLAGVSQLMIQQERLLLYLTLFGDASSTPGSEHDHVPTFFYRDRSSSGDTVTASFDLAYSRLATCDSCRKPFFDSIPYRWDMNPNFTWSAPAFAVGRIPAHTLTEAKTYVNKVLAYEAQYTFGPWSQTWGFVADDDRRSGGPENIFAMPSLGQPVWQTLTVKPFVRRIASIEFPLESDTSNQGANDSLIKLWNQGLGFLFFIGHGSPIYWANEHIFNLNRDLPRLHNEQQLPIVITLGCLTAPFSEDSVLSMGEALILSPQGAIAFIGTQFESYPGPNNALAAAWLKNMEDKGNTLGTSFRLSMNRDEGFANPNDDTFAIMGDPALTLHLPEKPVNASASATRVHPSFQTQVHSGDSLAIEIVRVDSISDSTYAHFPVGFYSDYSGFCERESVLHREVRALSPGESEVSFSVSDTLNPSKHAIKVLVWNSQGMRYGYFPLEQLPMQTLALHETRPKSLTQRRLISLANLSGTRTLQVTGARSGFKADALGRR